MNQNISVIVPVYNVEKYLTQCVESILSQDHSNLEVILIDDGSTDRSGEICDQFAARDSRVQVIHQKNAGAAAAKNAGLRIASGTYLSFVDSDDYLEPNAYGGLVRTLLDTGADVVQGSFREIYRNRAEEQRVSEETLTAVQTRWKVPFGRSTGTGKFPKLCRTVFWKDMTIFCVFPRISPVPCCGISCTAGNCSLGCSSRKDTKLTTNTLPIRAFYSPAG